MNTVNPLSITSFYTEIFYNNNKLGTATAFAYLYNDKKYLVTNYHVAYGINPTNNVILNINGMVPNKLKFYYYNKDAILKYFEICYINGINPFKFISINGILVDIAVFELPNNTDVVCINDIQSIKNHPKYEKDLIIEIADTLFVLGYPRGISILYTPIWKRSSIASEPDIKINDIPYFYIDTTTREGMSGAPVIFYSINGNYKTPKSHVLASGQTYKFIGIYSGRDCAGEPYLAQLGKVWKKELIDKIIKECF